MHKHKERYASPLVHKYTKTHILIYKLSTCARDKSLSLRTDLTDALPVLKRESHYAIYEAYSVVQVGLKVKGEVKEE